MSYCHYEYGKKGFGCGKDKMGDVLIAIVVLLIILAVVFSPLLSGGKIGSLGCN